MNERQAMQRALDLAWRGWGRVHPNPMVGAVVLAGDAVIAEGFHAEYGGPHAEVAALAAAGDRARGGTLVTTLEPCAHHGKQPPCTEAILRAGIRRVVAALADPNPVAAGGAARLRAAGVEVEFGLLAETAAAQNAAFLRGIAEPSRPFVALKLATSLDFRIADRSGQARWISGPEARAYAHWLRAGFDAIAVGAGTARADDPALTVRGAVTPRVTPRRVVFDRRAELPVDCTVVRTAREVPTLVVTTPAAPGDRIRQLEAHGVRVIVAPTVAEQLGLLRAEGVLALLVEGGGRLAGELLAAGVVDRFYWIQAPIWLGEHAVPALRGAPDVPLAEVRRWRVAERRALDGDTLLVLDGAPCLPAS